MKHTPLYENHRALGAKIVAFGGWDMPIQYEGIIREHRHTRHSAGLFDVSHMGEISVQGKNAEEFVQRLVTNNIAAAAVNQIVYSPMCYPDGGIADDLLIYKFSKEDYLLIVNASNTDKDFAWILEQSQDGVAIRNASDTFAQIAIQGPAAEAILQRVTPYPLSEIRFYHFIDNIDAGGIRVMVSRTGYTGEDGFELYLPAADGPLLWEMLLESGREDGLVPAGLGARDTLRLEAALPLYGNELSPDITPLEAGLGIFVKLDKDSFIGKEALVKQKTEGVKRKIIGFEMQEPGIPRSHYTVYYNGSPIGHVTSGSYSPTLEKNLGLALIDAQYTAEGTVLEIIIRDKPVRAVVVPKPFYKKRYKK